MSAVFFLSSLYCGKLNNNHIDETDNFLDFICNETTILDKKSGEYNFSSGNLLLRLEGRIVFICCLFSYNYFNGNLVLFVFLLLIPDISALGYLINKKTGTILYNCFHTYVLPLILLIISISTASHIMIMIGLIWTANISLDRFFGYGLNTEER